MAVTLQAAREGDRWVEKFMLKSSSTKSYVYVLCNRHRSVVYVGSIHNLRKRAYFHKKHLIPSFTQKYNVDVLIYFEEYVSLDEALKRERQIKKYRREKKDKLLQNMNPQWIDLYERLRR